MDAAIIEQCHAAGKTRGVNIVVYQILFNPVLHRLLLPSSPHHTHLILTHFTSSNPTHSIHKMLASIVSSLAFATLALAVPAPSTQLDLASLPATRISASAVSGPFAGYVVGSVGWRRDDGP